MSFTVFLYDVIVQLYMRQKLIMDGKAIAVRFLILMHKLQHDIKIVVKQSVLRWNALLPFTVKTRINHESKKKRI